MEAPGAEEQVLPSFAKRARDQEARRAVILARRQAERDEKRAAKASYAKSSMNSAAADYDPVEVGRRRREMVEAATARKAAAADKANFGLAREQTASDARHQEQLNDGPLNNNPHEDLPVPALRRAMEKEAEHNGGRDHRTPPPPRISRSAERREEPSRQRSPSPPPPTRSPPTSPLVERHFAISRKPRRARVENASPPPPAPPPPVVDDAKEAHDHFQALLRRDDDAAEEDDDDDDHHPGPAWNNDSDASALFRRRRAPPPNNPKPVVRQKRQPAAAAKEGRRRNAEPTLARKGSRRATEQRELREQREQRESEAPLPSPRELEMRRRAAIEEEESRPQSAPKQPPKKPPTKRAAAAEKLPRRNGGGPKVMMAPRRSQSTQDVVSSEKGRGRRASSAGSEKAPLCVRREMEQRRKRQLEAAEPETRRCLDKRTARLRYARHFAAAVSRFRARALSPSNRSTPREDTPASNNRGAHVVVRCRPLLPHESARGDFVAVSTDLPFGSVPKQVSTSSFVTVHECTMHADMVRMLHAARRFPCDSSLGATATEAAVYESAARPAVKLARKGATAALFMFGQTGSGKTHTMEGFEQRAAKELFSAGSSKGKPSLRMTYFEICGKRAFDLLRKGDETGEGSADQTNGKNERLELRLVDTEPQAVVGAFTARPRSPAAILEILRRGRKRRATAPTEINGGSSRSHAVCRIELHEEEQGGSLTLVDCAGSERNHDSMYHDADRRKESAEINQSLYALKACIRAANALKKAKQDPSKPQPPPVPFRQSALTRVLRDAFEREDAHLCVVATLSPAATDAEHSIATLRTVCELAGCSPKVLASCSGAAAVVPKAEETYRDPHSGAPVTTLPTPPSKWTTEQLAAFLRRQQFEDAARDAERLGLNGKMLWRMSLLGISSSLAGDDSKRAGAINDAVRTEADRCEKIHAAARARRRNSSNY